MLLDLHLNIVINLDNSFQVRKKNIIMNKVEWLYEVIIYDCTCFSANFDR